MTYEIDLTGHRALVTGGGQGVGEEIARTLAQAGAEVLVNDLVDERAQRVVDGIVADGGQARPAVFDVTDYPAVVAAIEDGRPGRHPRQQRRQRRARHARWAWRTSPAWSTPIPPTGRGSSR